jgi:hypothetical protein
LSLASLWLASGAGGHTRSISHSSWRLDETGARVKLRIPRLELTRVGLDAPPQDSELSALAGRYLANRLLLRAGASGCARAGGIEQRRADEGWAAFAWRYECAAGPPTAIETRILLDAAPSHLHFARLSLDSGRITERVLTDADPAWEIPDSSPAGNGERAPAGSKLRSYLLLGVEHIVTGWDHLAFVLALLILAGTLGEMARIVTGFTIAHSVTLALAVLGFVHPQAGAVEAVIGFSVALVAAENAWAPGGRGRAIPLAAVGGLALCGALALAGVGNVPAAVLLGLALFCGCHFALLERSERPARIRGALAFAFGLVHGFGFAGVLGEMELPTERLAPALFGFNVGVEIGQLAVVSLAWPLLRGLERLAEGRWYRLTVDFASAAICAIGIFWFVTRSYSAS